VLIGFQFLLSIVVGASVLSIVMGIRAFVASEKSENRVSELIGGGGLGPPLTLRQLEMRTSFYERAISPLSNAILGRLGRLAPQRNIEELDKKLERAGFPGNLSVVDFLGLKILVGIFLGGAFAVLIYLFRSNLILTAGFGLALGLAGFWFPNYWLSIKITARQTEILKSLPDALDMMVICVDAGLGLFGAMQRICDNWDNALVEELIRVIAEVKLGRSNLEALESMGQRVAVKEVSSFVMALNTAYKLGMNISQVLHIQAEQVRIARRQKAEELAHQAAIKMLFPLVFLIFPAMFAVILGPAIPQLLETLRSL
jgi:tight adherence protein C